jgi:NAD(P)-dependent dehydrogenase (short-subunit alcohol dehydrogenase family)
LNSLEGKVVALVGRGTPVDRSIAVSFAEGGGSIALATVSMEKDEEFAVNSIANEVWSIGRDHLVRQMTAWEPTAAASFADECFDRFGRCDVLVINTGIVSQAPLEELSGDEWDHTVRTTMTAPFLLGHAFGRLMVREGGGLVVVLAPNRDEADLSERAAVAGLRVVVEGMREAWAEKGVHFVLIASEDDVTSPESPVANAAMERINEHFEHR